MVPFLILVCGLFETVAKRPDARTPPMGWSTWCTSASCYQSGFKGSLHDYCDENMILTVAQAMKTNGMLAAGYEYILLDDCWAWIDRDPKTQDLQADPTRFPHGMPALINTIHDMGFKFGLYTSVGPTTCSSGGRNHSIPGSYGHNQQDADLYARWQVDWMTMDYCDWHFNETVLFPAPATRRMREALDNTNYTTWLLFHCVGYDLVGTEWCKEVGNSFTISSDHHDNWHTTDSIFQFLAEHPPYVGQGAWPDPDFLMTGGAGCDDLTPGKRCPGMTDDEYRSEFSIWVLAGGQLVVSSDPRNISALQSEILLNSEMLAVFHDPAYSIGSRLLYDVGHNVSVWAKAVNTTMHCVAAGVLNAAAHTLLIFDLHFVLFATVSPVWTNTTKATVRDLWQHKDLPPATGSLRVTNVPPHATVVVKLCPS